MEIDPLKNRVDPEMKVELKEQRKTKPFNMFLLIASIVGGLLVVAIIGAYWSSHRATTTANMGAVTKQDTAIIIKSDTLKQ